MSSRILIVDDLVPNLNLLEVKLAAEYYDVVRATNGLDALKIARSENVDLILLDAIMPGLNGFETCAQLKTDPATWHIPVVMVTALEETRNRIRGLEAGADDFVTKPIDEFNLMARVRSLLRLKMVTDQLMSHTTDSAPSRDLIDHLSRKRGNVLIVDDQQNSAARIENVLGDSHNITAQNDPKEAIIAATRNVDLLIVSLTSEAFDGLRLCARLRSDPRTQDLPILAITEMADEDIMVRAYDTGINDTVMRPIEAGELQARVNTQLKRKFYADSLRDDFHENLEMVISDPLTGLGNRRFFDRSVGPLLEGVTYGRTFSLVVFDVDHFKRVNDILGHDVGDDVLKEIAARLVTNMRAIDIVSRYGGEEFLIAMPGATADEATAAADRIRGLISGTPIFIDGAALKVSVSAGIAEAQKGEKVREIFKRADDALYAAKKAGRDQVMQSQVKVAA
ncbi:PleD family two-component system response regulator [Robiginitomaculum antarcticum]|uniref:PleD family two-component system response regulator n=1 Tax=Robiginitomaculum antarcticum TaxID=437507 RepID=UPI00036B1A33|nr:PleD family two-component system response regulator [Robiginitomaculum antarcticum]